MDQIGMGMQGKGKNETNYKRKEKKERKKKGVLLVYVTDLPVHMQGFQVPVIANVYSYMRILRTVVRRENVAHHTQPMCTYHALKPEQKTVQVKDSSTKPSYQQKPLSQLPEREGNSMNITGYECGQAGHIWTNCPRLTKVRTAAIREDGTEDPEMDPQEDDEVLPPDKEGEGDSSEHQEE